MRVFIGCNGMYKSELVVEKKEERLVMFKVQRPIGGPPLYLSNPA